MPTCKAKDLIAFLSGFFGSDSSALSCCVLILANGVGIYLTPLFISDCIEALLKLVDLNHSKTILYNLAGSEIIDLSEILDILEGFLNKKPNRINTNEEPLYITGSNDRISHNILYQPKVNIYEGLKKTVKEYFKNV